VLDKDASFRGKVIPEKWSHTADQIVTERWRSKFTCTEMSQGAKSDRQDVRILTVGESNITLSPSRAAALIGNKNYALDVGNFVMAAKDPSNKSLAGPYVILWKRDGKSWKMMHIDMNPEGTDNTKQ
jgi:hypothetical protein